MQRNPTWTRDEVALLLDLFFRLGRRAVGPKSAEVIELSNFLNNLSIHTPETRGPNFRNPTGISMKLANLLRLDPSYGGDGLMRGGQLEAKLWEEYAGNLAKLHHDAAEIRSRAAI